MTQNLLVFGDGLGTLALMRNFSALSSALLLLKAMDNFGLSPSTLRRGGRGWPPVGRAQVRRCLGMARTNKEQ